MHILLIDDDEDIRELLGLALRTQGHQVEEAADGVEAWSKLRRGSVSSLMILDLMMPRLDGEGLLKRMRADPRLARVPVCIISGHHEAREKAQELGAVGCLVKPIELDELLAVVRGVASGTEART